MNISGREAMQGGAFILGNFTREFHWTCFLQETT
jgi:hypothetical protein